jgi:single-strand DNA-binding protein
MSGKATIDIVGLVAKDPELRYTGEGKAVCSFSIPVQERKDGETTWYKITAWEKQAETINQYVTKGSWLWVRGVPKVETWEKDGETKAQLAVTLREFTFCGSKSDNGNASEEAPRQQAPAKQAAQPQRQVARNAPKPIDNDSDLPF